MTITRRGFLTSGTAVAAGAAILPRIVQGEQPTKPEGKREAVLRLASQLNYPPIPGRDVPEKLATMEKWGFEGVELGGIAVRKEKEYAAAIKNTKLKVSDICWGSCHGDLVSDSAEKRAAAVDTLKRVVNCAAALQVPNIVYTPAFNEETKLGNQEIRKHLVDMLPVVGEYAAKHGTRIVMEPLARQWEFFLRQVADGAAICRDCKSPGIGVMGDFYHMFFEETSDMGAFISGGTYLHHVHMASRLRKLPGQDDRQFVDGFRGLKWIGYQDYCSFECEALGDPAVEIPKSMAFLREQWEKA
jgi:sugar phosphate isomerase/epimerase